MRSQAGSVTIYVVWLCETEYTLRTFLLDLVVQGDHVQSYPVASA